MSSQLQRFVQWDVPEGRLVASYKELATRSTCVPSVFSGLLSMRNLILVVALTHVGLD